MKRGGEGGGEGRKEEMTKNFFNPKRKMEKEEMKRNRKKGEMDGYG